MNLSLKPEKYFPQVSLFVLIFNSIFHSYVILCSILQFIVLFWGILLIYKYHKQDKIFIISCLSICLLLFCTYLFKGKMDKAWTFFIKVICIFMFISLLKRDNLSEYLNTYSLIMVFFSTLVITISFISMLFITDISQIPSFLSPISVYIYESSICRHIEPRYIGFFGNPNQSGIFASLTILSSLYLIINKNKYSYLALFNVIIQFGI